RTPMSTAMRVTFTEARTALVPFGTAAIALSLYTVLHPEVRRQRREPSDDVDSSDAPTEPAGLPRPPRHE
ncbi:MAG: hypothetical protein ACO3SP_11780, partial [Ilumatobacteraceae bacterium]